MKQQLLSFFALATVLLPCSGLFAQLDLEEVLDTYRQRYLPEKIFVHTDKSIYAAGETIWAAVYQVDAQSHYPDSLSRIIYLELRSPTDELLIQHSLYPRDGHTYGDLSLPASLPPGVYQLTAYTHYQRNSPAPYLFRKAIRILPGLKESGGVTTSASPPPSTRPAATAPPAPDLELRFFPEGGDCVDGIPCRVAVTATEPDGSPSVLAGYLTNESGETITVFQTNETGIGTINYTPRAGQKTIALVKEGKYYFPLPEPLVAGFHLNVLEHKDTVRISMRTNLPETLAGASLLLHLRGIPILNRPITEQRDRALFTLAVSDLPAGVITATLFNAWSEPVAERLFYVAPKETELQLQTDAASYSTRAPVDLFIKMPYLDAKTDSLSRGRISLSVVPTAATGGPSGDDIRSWLLLNSDLDRPVPYAPELLFAADERERKRRIEDYLLTRQWRRFDWKAITDSQPFQPDFLLEQGIYLRGQMTAYGEEKVKPRPGKVFLSRIENGYAEETVTNENGEFAFGPYLLFDTLDVALQGRFRSGKKNRRNPDITLNDNSYVNLATVNPTPPSLPVLNQFSANAAEPAFIDLYEDISQRSLTVSRNFDSLIIDLDVVDVVSKRTDPIEQARKERTQLYGSPDNRVLVSEVPWAYTARSAFELLRTVPGLLITGNPGSERVQIRGQTSITLSSEPAYFIDGVSVSLETVRNFPVLDLEFIDVLKGARAAIFGTNGANGAILLYTRRGGPLGAALPQPGLLNTQVLGYYKARQFAVFDATLPANRNRPDVRTTLHWNPDLRTNVLGLARDQIITSDQPGRYIIVAQGLRKDGRPFYGTGEFFVE